MASVNLPSWLPDSAEDIQEELARATLRKIQRCQVHVPLMQRTVQTAYLATAAAAAGTGAESPPLILLSSFDGSCLEFRRLMPLLEEAGLEAYALDVVGWGFTEAGIKPGSQEVLGPAERRAHLLAFWQHKVKQPAIIVGCSMGASTAMDFALNHPEATAKLALMGPAAWNEGLSLFPLLPRWLAQQITKVVRNKWFRRRDFGAVFYDQSLASEDMMRISSLHTDVPGWDQAIMAFVRGRGYHLRSEFPKVTVETLVLWGRNDKFANPKYAHNYEENIKRCQVVWLEQCGHWASFEQPTLVAKLLHAFAESGLPVDN